MLPLTQLIPYWHTFTIVSLLFALMADLCLPLSAGEDTLELHSVQLELEAEEKQAQLREAQLYSVCFSPRAPCTRDAIFPDVLHSGAGKPRTLGAAAEEAIQAPGDVLSPSTASGLRDLHPKPLRSSPRDGTRRCDRRRLHRPARRCYVSWR